MNARLRMNISALDASISYAEPSRWWQSPAGIEGRGNVTRDAAGRDQHGVEADVVNAVIGMTGQPDLGGGGDARLLPIGHRPCRIIQLCARFHLHEHEQMSAAGDDIDLAQRALPASRQNAETLCDEEARRAALGRQADAKRYLAFRIWLTLRPRPKNRT